MEEEERPATDGKGKANLAVKNKDKQEGIFLTKVLEEVNLYNGVSMTFGLMVDIIKVRLAYSLTNPSRPKDSTQLQEKFDRKNHNNNIALLTIHNSGHKIVYKQCCLFSPWEKFYIDDERCIKQLYSLWLISYNSHPRS